MQLQALDLSPSSFHEFLPIPLPPRAQFSIEPCGVNPLQHLGRFRLRLHLRHRPLTLCKAPSPVGPQLPPTSTSAPSPLLCRHSSVQPRAEPDGGTDVAGKLPVRKKAGGYFPARPTPHNAAVPGACAGVRVGACTCVPVPATCTQAKRVQAASKPERQDFAPSLRYCKLCLALRYSRGKSAPEDLLV